MKSLTRRLFQTTLVGANKDWSSQWKVTLQFFHNCAVLIFYSVNDHRITEYTEFHSKHNRDWPSLKRMVGFAIGYTDETIKEKIPLVALAQLINGCTVQ
jgi:hypothetical protein